jgi:hypothetical protein
MRGMDDMMEAIDYLDNRISLVVRGKPVRDLDEAFLRVRSLAVAAEQARLTSAERERIARADEREKCAKKATLWAEKWFSTNARIFIVPVGKEVSINYDDLVAAIREDGK